MLFLNLKKKESSEQQYDETIGESMSLNLNYHYMKNYKNTAESAHIILNNESLPRYKNKLHIS